MIKTTITPENNNCLIQIPDNYIGKELEVFIYAKDKLTINSKTNNRSMKDFLGIISDETATAMQKEFNNSH